MVPPTVVDIFYQELASPSSPFLSHFKNDKELSITTFIINHSWILIFKNFINIMPYFCLQVQLTKHLAVVDCSRLSKEGGRSYRVFELNMRENKKKTLIRGWVIIIRTGLHIKIDIAQKVIYETVLLPKFSPGGTIILAKEKFHNSYTFWALPILIFSPVQIIMTQPLI